MAQVVVRNIEPSVIARLKRRGEHHGRSLEAEVREILRRAAEEKESMGEGLGTFIARQFAGKGINFEVPEWHGEKARAARFRRSI